MCPPWLERRESPKPPATATAAGASPCPLSKHPFQQVLAGRLIPCNWGAGTTDEGNDLRRSGKAHRFAGTVQFLTDPDGTPLWVSDAEPGSEHGLCAARTRAPSPLDAGTRSRNRPVRTLRVLGEPAAAWLKRRRRAPRHATLSPGRIGAIVQTALVLNNVWRRLPFRKSHSIFYSPYPCGVIVARGGEDGAVRAERH